MARDDFSDYEELLNMYAEESDSPKQKKSTAQADLENELERSQSERRKRVQNFKVDISSDSSADKPSYKGGVYFSNPPRDIDKEAQREKKANARKTQNTSKSQQAKKFSVSAPPATAKQKKAIALKEAKAKKRAEKFGGKLLASEKFSKFALCAAIVVFTSVILCIYGIGCINDVLALNVDDVSVEVTVSENMTDGEVIDILEDNDLINHGLFCKAFVKILDITSDSKKSTYVSGVYTLSKSYGLEKMLSTMKADITLSETVTLTFPEGWTIDQIAEKLEANEVCTAASFISTLQTVDFSEEYSFIAAIPQKELRFRLLEGYIYPDTYDFYVGENASSVVRKFLNNFKSKWTDEYQAQADALGVSVDEAIVVASILQKEAASDVQMPNISSIIYNRLGNQSAFPWLQFDSTEVYLLETIKPTLTSSTEDTEKYVEYRDNYDTYSTECTGLPVGAICNPGDDAIKAALNPANTDYYYFCHDDDGNAYYANTFAKHQQNLRKIGG